MQKNKIFFASDFHLGSPDYESSRVREMSICRWLKYIQNEASEIYLLGDLFDFWFEHKYTAPKGFVRFLGTLAEISDSGIPIYVFTGNHDMWMFDYLEKEIGVKIYRSPIILERSEKKILISHGDGLGPGDYGYKFIKKIFSNKVCIWLFARLHPNFSFFIANYFSKKSRLAQGYDEKFEGEENEWLIQYCKEYLKKNPIDYFIFGHRHLTIDYNLNTSRYVNLGHWFGHEGTYAELDEKGQLTLRKWPVKLS
jgi:UDP-2,3-diacylglucosamine hydrolase